MNPNFRKSLIFPPEEIFAFIFAFCGTAIDHTPYGTWIFTLCSRASVASGLADTSIMADDQKFTCSNFSSSYLRVLDVGCEIHENLDLV